MHPEVRKLRIGILCSRTSFQSWQAQAIRHVLAVPGVKIVLLVIDGRTETAVKPPIGQFFYRKYRDRFFKPKAMSIEDLSAELIGIDRISCVPVINGFRESFSASDIRSIGDHRVDILLRFGFNILSGDILSTPTHGVWSFHHGDETEFRGGPPGFWEIMKGAKITGAILQRLTEKLDGGSVLRKGWFQTIDHSLEETVDTVLSQSSIWPAQVMREILNGHDQAGVGAASEKLGTLYRYPGNFTFLRFLWRLFRNKLRFHKRELNEHEEWNIGVLYQPIKVLLDAEASVNVRWLPTPAPDNFRADPFGYVTADGTLNVLYEKYDHRTGRGEISRVRPRKDSVLKRSWSMLASEEHLSYPYVVQRDDRIYLIPESASAGTVDLYMINQENDGVEKIGTLLDEALFDPTIVEHEGRWWMFGTKAPLTNVALHAYHSDRFEGPYVSHHLNPIKFDIRSARPAGTPFIVDGKLYRPAQDSSTTYGGRIAINQIIELTPDRFKETTIKFVGPLKGTAYDKGLHTVSSVGDITLVDGKRFLTVGKRKAEVRSRKIEKLKRSGRS
ncbi:MAG: hypothetical protein M3R08_02235 [Bacteroidota bacterium]|nr:hypothetical protein [Bacteroidota bacterium]